MAILEQYAWAVRRHITPLIGRRPPLRVAQRSDDERLGELAAAQECRSAYLARHGWRSSRIVAIDAELDRHWAGATLAAARQDDPLAFGVGSLRAARAHYAERLAGIDGATGGSGGEVGEDRRDGAARFHGGFSGSDEEPG